MKQPIPSKMDEVEIVKSLIEGVYWVSYKDEATSKVYGAFTSREQAVNFSKSHLGIFNFKFINSSTDNK